eukprot:55706-Eustigmatos_ZCMA.PRE.1
MRTSPTLAAGGLRGGSPVLVAARAAALWDHHCSNTILAHLVVHLRPCWCSSKEATEGIGHPL